MTICATLMAVGSLTARVPVSDAADCAALAPLQPWQPAQAPAYTSLPWGFTLAVRLIGGCGRRGIGSCRRQIRRRDRADRAHVGNQRRDVLGSQVFETGIDCFAHRSCSRASSVGMPDGQVVCEIRIAPVAHAAGVSGVML